MQNTKRKLQNYKTVLPVLRSMGHDGDGVLDLSAKGDPVYTPPGGNSADVGDGAADPNAPENTPEQGSDEEPGATPAPEDTGSLE